MFEEISPCYSSCSNNISTRPETIIAEKTNIKRLTSVEEKNDINASFIVDVLIVDP